MTLKRGPGNPQSLASSLFHQRLQLRLGPLAPRRQIQMIRTLAGTRPQERIDFSLDVNHLLRLGELSFKLCDSLVPSCCLDGFRIQLWASAIGERQS
jgi:hypothetical protein